MIDATTIWQRLREDGGIADQPPEAQAPTPWVARLLTGVAAWIATPLFLAFIAMLLGDLLVQKSASIIIGAIMCAATILPLRRSGSEFLQQGATIISVAGIALVGFGLGEGINVSDSTVAFVLLLLSATLFALSRVPVHQFMCAGILVFASLWLLDGTSPTRLSMLQPFAAWAAVALWWLSLHADPVNRGYAHLPPLAWAVTLTAIGLAWFDPYDPGLQQVDPALIVGLRYAGAALLPVTALALGAQSLSQGDRRLFVLLVCAAIVLAWLWQWSPGVTFALSLMLVAFARGAAVLLAVSVIALAVYLVAYYFQLSVPLLTKALWLGMAGALLTILHVALRRWPEANPP